jgi:CheY-like chemotaxis protein
MATNPRFSPILLTASALITYLKESFRAGGLFLRARPRGTILPGRPGAMSRERAAHPQRAEESRVPTKILVADDSATMRRVLEMTFAGEDARVVSVDNGEAAVAKAGELLPDIVFADASMNGVDGYEVARRIKSNPQLAKVAVIVMASQHTPYDDGKGRAAGVDDHVPKPFDTQSIIDRVAQVLSRPRNAPAGDAKAPPPAPRPVAAGMTGPSAPPPRSPVHATRMGLGAPAPVPPPPAPAAARPQPAPAAAAAAAAPQRAAAVAPAPAPAAARPAPVAAPAPAPAPVTEIATASLAQKLGTLGLSREQLEGVLALSREVIEQVVWEVVPELAEQLIKEEIKRLTAD